MNEDLKRELSSIETRLMIKEHNIKMKLMDEKLRRKKRLLKHFQSVIRELDDLFNP